MLFLSDCKVKDFCLEIAKYLECKCFYALFDVINSQIDTFLCPIKKTLESVFLNLARTLYAADLTGAGAAATGALGWKRTSHLPLMV